MAGSEVLGYVGVVIACVFFGTSYVPTKKYPTYDGIIFQWFMCSGILTVGLAWGLYQTNWSHVAEQGMYAFPQGLLGGGLWAVGNILIPTVVNMIGLGPGFMIWNGANLLSGYAVARFGLFGVEVSKADASWSNQFGMLCMMVSIGVFGMIRPKHDSEKDVLLGGERDSKNLDLTLPNVALYDLAADPHTNVETPSDHSHIIGPLLAVFVGMLLGNSLTPYARWHTTCIVNLNVEQNPVLSTCDSLDFFFSQTVGIYMVSTVAMILYSTFHKLARRPMPRSAMRPAFISGVLWGIALGGQLLALGNMGYAQAYPLTAIGPAIVSMMWSFLYFQEIEGKRNVTLMLSAFSLVLIGIFCQKPDIPVNMVQVAAST